MRHIFIGGTSFCGSTTMSLILGGAQDVINISESNWLVPNYGVADISQKLWDDWNNIQHCRLCGPNCEVWTRTFREGLQRDPTNWYQKLSERAGKNIVVSAEKSLRNLNRLDATHSNQTLVLFRHPLQHWLSSKKRPWKGISVAKSAKQWLNTYKGFISDDYAPKHGKVFLSLDEFMRHPEYNLPVLGSALGLDIGREALAYWNSPQHYFGGNYNVYERLKAAGIDGVKLRSFEPAKISEEEGQVIRSCGALDLHAELLRNSVVAGSEKQKSWWSWGRMRTNRS